MKLSESALDAAEPAEFEAKLPGLSSLCPMYAEVGSVGTVAGLTVVAVIVVAPETTVVAEGVPAVSESVEGVPGVPEVSEGVEGGFRPSAEVISPPDTWVLPPPLLSPPLPPDVGLGGFTTAGCGSCHGTLGSAGPWGRAGSSRISRKGDSVQTEHCGQATDSVGRDLGLESGPFLQKGWVGTHCSDRLYLYTQPR